MLDRRSILAAAAIAAMAGGDAAAADQKVKIALYASYTGGDAASAERSMNGALLALEEANAAKAVKGVIFEPVKQDDGTATAGQFDPAQAAINARKTVSDKAYVAGVGPQMSGAGKAMSPILSAANLATITPSSTNPDITDPKFAAQFRPGGKAVYFRTVTTDAFQGPNMANYFADVLKVKSVYVLDDTGAYGEGLANAFEGQAKKKGLNVLGHDKLDPKAADYAAVLTKIKALNPDSLYYGGVFQAGVKLVKQSYEIIPNVIKSGGDGLYGPEMFTAAGYPAAEGWYATIASPHLTEDPKNQSFVKRFTERFKTPPDDYSITAYNAALVVIDSVKRVHASGKPVTREHVRDAIQSAKVSTLQGEVSFDENGDLNSKVISVFRATKNDAAAMEETDKQYKYVGVAPQS